MKQAPPVEFPEKQDRALRTAKRLAWATIGYYCIDATLLYLLLGRSQAMKAAWLQDAFAIIPPIGFLIAIPVSTRRPNERFPYGYHRVVSIAFLFSAIALLGLGIYLVIDSVIPFVQARHPTIGGIRMFGHTFWLGWPMLAALLCSSAIPPFFLGRAKLEPARVMHDKVLYCEAQMDKAGWLSAASAMAGVLGIGLGYWWADYVAALVISVLVLRDAYRNTRESVLSLMDEVPKTTDLSRVDPVTTRVANYLGGLDWVAEVEVRFREEGHVFFGEASVVPADKRNLVEKIRRAVEDVRALDWRIYEFAIMPVPAIDDARQSGVDRPRVG